jgi:adenylate cyclase
MDMEYLTEAELAREAQVLRARIRQLTEIGVLQPDAGGRYLQPDIQRVRIVGAYEAAGIGLEFIAQAIQERRLSFFYSDRIYPTPSRFSGKTVADLEVELEAPGIVTDLYVAMGLARPDPDRELTVADVDLLTAFVDAWRPSRGWPETMYRAARLVGDSYRRAVEGWVSLFAETMAVPAEEAKDLTITELHPRVMEPGARLAQIVHPTAIWLVDRNLERALNAINVEAMEDTLAARGLKMKPPGDPPAVVFADLTGYTTLTEELGDEQAAARAARLSVLGTHVASDFGGRLVKELGDGIMLVFPDVASAARAALALREAAEADELPALHVGISAGPLIERDGDFYGRVVNLAARLSAAAEPREILLSAAAAAGLPDALVAEQLGPRRLKGFADSVVLYRLTVDTLEAPP